MAVFRGAAGGVRIWPKGPKSVAQRRVRTQRSRRRDPTEPGGTSRAAKAGAARNRPDGEKLDTAQPTVWGGSCSSRSGAGRSSGTVAATVPPTGSAKSLESIRSTKGESTMPSVFMSARSLR